MTVNEKIIEALKEFGMPIALNHYSGKENRYIEFDLYDDSGALFCDDAPEFDIIYVQVHVFLPAEEPYLKLKKDIRQALMEAGFCYADITESVDSNPANGYPKGIRQINFETEIDED